MTAFLPDVYASKPDSAGAHSQNWCAVQGPAGMMYFGNTAGVLVFNGVDWTLVRTPNESIVRSLAVDRNGTVWVGAVGEVGFLQRQADGAQRYISLVDRLSPELQQFADVWQTFATDTGIYFCATERLLRWHNDTFSSWDFTPQVFVASINDRLIYNERGTGLTMLVGEELVLLPGGEQTAALEVMAILPWSADEVLLATRSGDLFRFTVHSRPARADPQLRPLEHQAKELLRTHRLYRATALGNGNIALATMDGGAVVIDRNGSMVLKLDRESGLPDLSVWHLYVDHQDGLWLSLNRGIARVETSTALLRVPRSSGLDGTVEAVLRHDGALHVGTSTGLYRLRGERFEKLEGVPAPCWALLTVVPSTGAPHELLVGTYQGTYRVRGRRAESIQSCRNAFVLHQLDQQPDVVLVGDTRGLRLLQRQDTEWLDLGAVAEVEHEVRGIAEANDRSIWLGTRYHGLIRTELHIGSDGRPMIAVSQHFGADAGLPTLSSIRPVPTPDGMVFASTAGLFAIDSTGAAQPSSLLGDSLAAGELGVHDIIHDTDGNLWLVMTEHLPLLARRDSNGGYTIEEPGLRRLPTTDITTLYPEDNGIVWIGSPRGLYRLDTNVPKDDVSNSRLLLTRVATTRGPALPLDPEPSVTVPYDSNSVDFAFALTSYDDLGDNRYRFRLQGIDDEWSEWKPDTEVTYSRLREGRYLFEIEARNTYGTLIGPVTYEFSVAPPWYRSVWAYLAYTAGAVLLIWGIVAIRSLKLERQRDRLEQLVEKRTEQLATRTEQLETVTSIVEAINTELSFDNLLRTLLDQVRSIEGLEGACLLVREPGTRQFRVRAATGKRCQSMDDRVLTSDELQSSILDRTEEIDPDIFIARDTSENLPQTGATLPRARSLLVLQLRIDGEVTALLVLINISRAHAFDQTDIELLRKLKGHILAAMIKARLLDELKTASDAKSEVLRIAAHDFRSPLASILSGLQLLRLRLLKGDISSEEGAQRTSQLIDTGRRTLSLLERLLDLSVLESGTMKLDLTPVDLSTLLRRCCEGHKQAAADKSIQLAADAPATLPRVLADELRVSEVLDNLVSNAIKYTHPEGTVHITTTVGSDEVITSVVDTGQGLSEDDLERVFRSFKRLSAQPTAGESSTGLGLAIARTIVELHGGRIWVRSTQGQGATFSFTLPVATESSSDEPASDQRGRVGR